MTEMTPAEKTILKEVQNAVFTTRSRVLSMVGGNHETARKALERMIYRGQLIECGAAGELGLSQFRRTAQIIALPGSIIPPKPEKYEGAKVCAYKKNVFAPISKVRDPFAAWKLCERAPFDPVRDSVRLVR